MQSRAQLKFHRDHNITWIEAFMIDIVAADRQVFQKIDDHNV